MKTLKEYAQEASRAVGRYYGRTAHFNEPPQRYVPCAEFFEEHWRRFPGVAPDGGRIIDGEAIEIIGFLTAPPVIA